MKRINFLARNSSVPWKHVASCVLVSLMLASPASAILRPRYPAKPSAPFNGQVIIIVEDDVLRQNSQKANENQAGR